MYTPEFKNILTTTLNGLREEGLYKEERFIASQQYSQVTLKDGRSVINMCANNYLGLANNPEVMEAAKKAIDQWGFGMASVRFICGTQTLHRQLEERLSEFLGTEDTILFPSCFDANGGLFEGLLTADDAIISDSLNHASIIDGVRLCKAKRFRYANNDMADLEAKLQEADAAGARVKLISTDGVIFHGRHHCPGLTRFTNWRPNTTPSSISTTATPRASLASGDAGRMSTAACSAR